MDVVALIGRVLFVLLFLGSALNHLTHTSAMTAYTESKGVRPARASVLGSGVWMAVAAVLVLLGLWGDLGALMLVVFLLPSAFLMHAFWRERDGQTRSMEQTQFLKDLALAGAALLVFVLFRSGEMGLTATSPLFGTN
ncbi:putative membrane protein YphA, DoxX/SURF4 family [Streptoalloteichus tenebrarius]|uniref:Membrane protein YphA, DoxX/SURF4 family n=1 Tax=Streptoalloteichus tenebrarius (strain ATCC 17920 / DSM 40477 / JCM 4838 / CBS 697.72 / NBRC 16177 / NCIMB 11028 / NRRL B-12390 / A12253. 1 / ISP 5477) TaxID=1933 RepID=A0ABT1I0B4_STRSD|nr:DoxX family protein [Streptoalloteichus tenebrarius]MCP2261228.1 putative membrane protein YphA, DoxX/SURF4 family [Streptoalloteichus tenebrarius]BFF04420.1 hypothetical protein GCM10020241_60950 [Streptoalloteichus tenebrarius]